MPAFMTKWLAILFAVFLVSIEGSSTKDTKKADPNPLFNNGVAPKNLEDGRLPTTIEPVHYDLEIRPDIYTGQPPFINTGHVDIIMRAVNATNQIVLNMESAMTLLDDTMLLASIDSPDPAPSIVGWGVLPDLDFLVITLISDLVPGRSYSLSVSFMAELSDQEKIGLYSDSYVKDGLTRNVVGSQLQPIYARKIFPVFDEPSFKVTFDVTIGRKSSHSAVSNGVLLDSEEVEDDWILDHFDSTPLMSCYLLAFAVIDFGYTETITPLGTINRLWVRDDALEAAEFANEIIVPIMDWLDTYTNYKNILPIVDHVVLPSHSGAMENWGLVIYGEPFLLWHEDWFNAYERSETAYITAHELAHFVSVNDSVWLTCTFREAKVMVEARCPQGTSYATIVSGSQKIKVINANTNTKTVTRSIGIQTMSDTELVKEMSTQTADHSADLELTSRPLRASPPEQQRADVSPESSLEASQEHPQETSPDGHPKDSIPGESEESPMEILRTKLSRPRVTSNSSTDTQMEEEDLPSDADAFKHPGKWKKAKKKKTKNGGRSPIKPPKIAY
ncbi:hypothetical protein CAPTEDRAFT_213473 [Capitella teleta]|uniref:Uncharacterized protein n=1 Tax=Capitella teleta TaxID=283909 RepID=R7UVX7_CAPTE|nr:hypothetical protein CAPTEDRAFT_213473 [Capitella teleta]|eukprot:ELU07531.1 hypothetical protein CAPTEDRAFT_213473 [Capitella teleta]